MRTNHGMLLVFFLSLFLTNAINADQRETLRSSAIKLNPTIPEVSDFVDRYGTENPDELDEIVFSENFEDGTEGWTIVDVDGGGISWIRETVIGLDDLVPAFMIIDANTALAGTVDHLISPSFDCSGLVDIDLIFDSYFELWIEEYGYVQVSSDGGTTWNTVFTFAETRGDYPIEIDISAFATNEPDVKIRFRYDDSLENWGLFWGIDNIVVEGDEPPDPAELQITDVDIFPSIVLPGQNVHVELTIENTGEVDATDFAVDWFYNEDDPPVIGQNGDYSWDIVQLPSGAHTDLEGDVAFDETGTMNMYFIVDTDQDVYESNENNNISGPHEVVVDLPDIQIIQVTIDPDTLLPGDTANVQVTVRNLGITEASTFNVEWFQDEQVAPQVGDEGDDTWEVESLLAQTSIVLEGQVVYNTVGYKQMYFIADNNQVLDETDETNNISGPHAAEVAYPDLVIFEITVVPQQTQPGDDVHAIVTILNQGLTDAESFSVEWFHDAATPPGIGDHGDESWDIDSLEAFQLITVDGYISYDSPGQKEMYFVIDTDNNVTESDENNNISDVEIIDVAYPDLEITAVTLNPQTAQPGETVEVSVTVENLDDADAWAFDIDWFYDLDIPPQIGDQGDFSWNIPQLSAQSNITLFAEISFDNIGDMNMFFIVDTDNNINESNEENNIEGPHTLNVVAPELSFLEIVISDDEILQNEETEVSLTVENSGEFESGSFRVDWFYNEEETPQIGDVGDHFWVIDNIPGGENIILTGYVSYDSAVEAQNYFIVDTDNTVSETDENNNIDGPYTITVLPLGPDLVISEVVITPEIALPEQEISVSVTVQNIGGTLANPFRLDWFYELEEEPHIGEFGDFSWEIAGLIPDETFALDGTVTYGDVGIKQMYFIVDTDVRIDEANENNNVDGPFLVEIFAGNADLVISDILITPSEAQPDENIDVSFVLNNFGGSDVDTVYVEWFYDTDTPPDSGDIGDISWEITDLAALESVVIEGSTTYDDLGNYSMYFLVDSDDIVEETNEDNNLYGPFDIDVSLHQPYYLVADLDEVDGDIALYWNLESNQYSQFDFDDGTAEDGIFISEEELEGSTIGNRFSLNGECHLLEVSAYLFSDDVVPMNNVKFMVWDGGQNLTEPGMLIYESDELTPDGDGWLTHDVSQLELEFANRFWVTVAYPNPGGPYIGADEDDPVQLVSYYSDANYETWIPVNNMGYNADVMVRAKAYIHNQVIAVNALPGENTLQPVTEDEYIHFSSTSIYSYNIRQDVNNEIDELDDFIEFIIYRNNLEADRTEDESFIETLPNYGVYEYYVVANWDEGISDPSYTLTVEWEEITTGEIAGNVFNSDNGNPVEGAEVKFSRVDEDSTSAAYTNEEGYYSFFDLPAGIYNVQVKAVGFEQELSEGNEVNVGEQTVVDFNLVPIPEVSIQTLQAELTEGTWITTSGTVTLPVNSTTNVYTEFYIQDDTGYGVKLFSYDQAAPEEILNRGTEIRVSGLIEEYFGVTEIIDYWYDIVSTGNPEPEPYNASTGDMALRQAMEGSWVRVTGQFLNDPPEEGSYTIQMDDGSGDIEIRIYETTGIDLSGYSTGDWMNIKGVLGLYQGDVQIIPGLPGDTYESDIYPPANLEAVLDTLEGIVTLSWEHDPPELLNSTGDELDEFISFVIYSNYTEIGNTQDLEYQDNLEEAGTYSYTVTARYDEGETVAAGPVDIEWEGDDVEDNALLETPTQWAIESTYPNPFNPTLNVVVAVPFSNNVVVEVYNVIGQRVAVLNSEYMQTGYHQLRWRADNFSSGLYFLSVRSNSGFKEIKKVMLIK